MRLLIALASAALLTLPACNGSQGEEEDETRTEQQEEDDD